MSEPAGQIDYNRIRRDVIAAFCDSAAPSRQSIMADWETDRKRDPVNTSIRPPLGLTRHERAQWYLLREEQGDNIKVRATETRRNGHSKPPTGGIDFQAQRMRRRIYALQDEEIGILTYFYCPGGAEGKYMAKRAVWRDFLPLLAGRTIETKSNALALLDSLLLIYRDLVMYGRGYPSEPWTMFAGMSYPAWRRTYRKIWGAETWQLRERDNLRGAIEIVDERTLELVR